MQLKNILVLLSIVFASQQIIAQDTTATPKPQPSKIKSYAELITPKTISRTGVFTVHIQDEKYYFEIPDSLLGRDLLVCLVVNRAWIHRADKKQRLAVRSPLR